MPEVQRGHLCNVDAGTAGPLEVYVAARPFSQFGGDLMQRLPCSAKRLMVDIGVCHYMVILESSSGNLTMFDFGPIGGDVHVGGPDLQAPSKQPKSKSIAGEVRLTELEALPETCIHLGPTHLTLNDVKAFNLRQNVLYELNVNDCRHYVNTLVQLATGVPNATKCLLQHQFMQRRSHTPKPVDHLVPPVQCLTDPNNWQRVQQSLHAAGVAVLLTLSHPVLIPPLASTSAIAGAALQGLLGSSAIQRLLVASSALAQQALLNKRALVSSCAVTLFGASHAGARDSVLRRPMKGMADVREALAMKIAGAVDRLHHAATAFAGSTRPSTHGLLGPLSPFKQGLTSRLASLSIVPPSPVEASALTALGTAQKQAEWLAMPPRQTRPRPLLASSAGALRGLQRPAQLSGITDPVGLRHARGGGR